MTNPSPPGLTTDKVPVQPPIALPIAPPLALPGPSVASGRESPSLGPRPPAAAGALARELSVWPDDNSLSDEFPAPQPAVGGVTEKSLRSFPGRPRPAHTLSDEPSLLPAKRAGLPRVQQRVPTGWIRSVTDSHLKRRKAKKAPRPAVAEPVNPRKGLSGTQWLLVIGVLSVLNAPLLIVSGQWIAAHVFEVSEPGMLSLEQMVALEIALEENPLDADDLLAKQGLDRARWAILRGEVTSDPLLRTEFTAIRTRLLSP